VTAWRKELAFNRIVYTTRRGSCLFVSVRPPQIPIGVPYEEQLHFGVVYFQDWDTVPESERANPDTEPEHARELPWESE
jgi:hypothetical protein